MEDHMSKLIFAAIALILVLIPRPASAQAIQTSRVSVNSATGCFSFNQLGSTVNRTACPVTSTSAQTQCAKTGGVVVAIVLPDRRSVPISACECPGALLFSAA